MVTWSSSSSRFIPITSIDILQAMNSTPLSIACRHVARAVGLAYVEQRMNDLHLLHHPPPVEQVLVFFGGEMDKDAVVGLDALDERVGEFVFL